MGQYHYEAIIKALPLLWSGMLLTCLLTILAICFGLALGTLLALMRRSPIKPLAWISALYVNLFRSTPLILVIFWFYFLVPLILGRSVGSFYSALIAFSLFEASYYSEIMRAGLNSVSRGQINAGRALGLTRRQNMQYTILPQAFRAMIPVLVTQAIILFQDTSLVYVVGLRDFMTTASVIAERDLRPVEMYTFAAVVYFIICFSGSLLVKRLQRRQVS